MSEFLERKVRTFFKHLDTNNDGVVSLKDFEGLADRHSEAQKLDAVEREKIKANFVELWRKWMKSAQSDDNGLLTPSIFVESVKQQRNDPEFKATTLTACHHFFRLLDVDGDGFLQEDEYARSFAQIGIKDTSIISRAFESIDLNKDGNLSWTEFSTALVEYLISEDENSPYVLLWGPLVK